MPKKKWLASNKELIRFYWFAKEKLMFKELGGKNFQKILGHLEIRYNKSLGKDRQKNRVDAVGFLPLVAAIVAMIFW